VKETLLVRRKLERHCRVGRRLFDRATTPSKLETECVGVSEVDDRLDTDYSKMLSSTPGVAISNGTVK